MMAEWVKRKMAEVTQIIMGQSPPSSTYNNNGEGLPFYQGKADLGFISPSIRMYCSEAIKIAQKNDILMSVRAPVGPVNLCQAESCIGRGLAAIRAKENIDYKFLYFLLGYMKPKIEILGTGSTFQAINKSKIENPPLFEQRKIAAILSMVQKAIETQTKLIERTTELKKAMMHKLFTEGTRGEKQKMTEIGLVPESWEVKSVLDYVSYIDYGVSQAIPKESPVDGVKIVSTADITKTGQLLYHQIRKISVPEKTKQRLTLFDGDVLFNWRNSAELIGKSAIYKKQPEQHIFASFILRIKCDEVHAHNRFFCYLMNYYRETEVFLKLARRAVNQANYNKNEISILKMICPTFTEQVEIANIIEQIDQKIENHKIKNRKYQELFRTLLHQLMTAQIRVNKIDFDKLIKEFDVTLDITDEA